MSNKEKAGGEDGRQRSGALVFGANGFGKSSLFREWAREYLQTNGRKSIRGLDPNGQFSDIPGMEWNPIENEYPLDTATRFLADIRREGFSGLILFDDADVYWGPVANPMFQQFFVSFRHWKCDWCASARRPQQVPKLAITCAQTLALFHVRDSRGRKAIEDHADVPGLMDRVPSEKFNYLRFDRDTYEETLCKTKRMQPIENPGLGEQLLSWFRK